MELAALATLVGQHTAGDKTTLNTPQLKDDNNNE
jgi:hypothetical protein